MSKKFSEDLKSVYLVVCYQSIVGVYAEQDDAANMQRELINKNRPADILCRPVTYPLNVNGHE